MFYKYAMSNLFIYFNIAGNVAGSYTIALPDGRLQTTRYTATNEAGFVADVSFEGTPVYPAEKAYAPAPYAPKPAYAPAPAPYVPAPAPYAPAPYAPAPYAG